MSSVLIDPTEGFDPFLGHQAASLFLDAAKRVIANGTPESMMGPNIVDEGRTAALSSGIFLRDGEAHALGYLAQNRVQERIHD